MNKKDIFVNAKFGDRFVTRCGDMAIYIEKESDVHYLKLDDGNETFSVYNPNGTYDDFGKEHELDIVGEWLEKEKKPLKKANKKSVNFTKEGIAVIMMAFAFLFTFGGILYFAYLLHPAVALIIFGIMLGAVSMALITFDR